MHNHSTTSNNPPPLPLHQPAHGAPKPVQPRLSQELALANPALREACSQYLWDWTEFVRQLLEEAKTAMPPAVDFDAEEVAWFLNSLWQGSMLVAKTRQDPDIIRRNLAHARAHVDGLFGFSPTPTTPT